MEEKLSASMPVEKLGLSRRVANALVRGNIRTLGELLQKTDEELLGLRHFGAQSLEEVKSRLSALSKAPYPERDERLRLENRELKAKVKELQAQATQASQAADFARLKELSARAKELQAWAEDIELPGSKLHFSFLESSVYLRITLPTQQVIHGGSIGEKLLLKFRDLIAEGIQKQTELADLRTRIGPLEELIKNLAPWVLKPGLTGHAQSGLSAPRE